MSTTEALAAKITEAIASSIPEITHAEVLARIDAKDRAENALRKTGAFVDIAIQTGKLEDAIFETLGDTDEAEAAANAASAALLGESARDVISAEDYATLTGRWFTAFEGK